MKPQKLEIGLLKYIKSSSNTYGYVELRDFLLYNFPQKSDMAERIEIKRFLKFLEGGEYIEIKSKRGISIIVEAGRAVPRNEISVIAKITPKGLELLEREKNNFDHPNAINFDLMYNDIKLLANNSKIIMPIYDYTKHIRKEETRIRRRA